MDLISSREELARERERAATLEEATIAARRELEAQLDAKKKLKEDLSVLEAEKQREKERRLESYQRALEAERELKKERSSMPRSGWRWRILPLTSKQRS